MGAGRFPLLLISLLLAWSAAAYPQVRTEKKIMVPMRDGVRLATDLYLPDRAGKYPVILTRSPYGRAGFGDFAEAMAADGYVGVWQDVRGRFDSEGEWVPFVHEADDGFDTIEWAAKQPWSNGKVFTFGGSYVAMDQWLAAKRKSPHLAGMMTFVSPGDFYQDFFYEGGAFALAGAALWSTFTDGKDNLEIAKLGWKDAFLKLPLVEIVKGVGHDPAAFRQWIGHPNNDAFWRALRFQEDIPALDFPVLHIAGWFDIFQKGTIENFRRMATQAKPAARSRQHLIVGPWGHTTYESPKVGEVDFGPGSVLGMRQVVAAWLDRYAKGKTDRSLPAVRVFMMGENQWHEYPSWPAPGTRTVAYYLRSGGKANGARGDGRLDLTAPPAKESADRYRYDPANPVPTMGGGTCCWPDIVPWGPMDQRPIEGREDILVYSTGPLETEVRVLGPVQLKLWISSSAPNTDFTAKLVDVAPDGFAMNLTDGIQRLSHRSSETSPSPLKPGTPTEITIDLWCTGNLFKPGHRIRLEVSSSNFPRYSRNLNTGGSPETTAQTAVATQSVWHDGGRPSRLLLPVVP